MTSLIRLATELLAGTVVAAATCVAFIGGIAAVVWAAEALGRVLTGTL